MSYLLYVILSCLIGALELVMLMMVITAVLSWFPASGASSSKIVRFIRMVTGTFVYPVRKFMERFPALMSFPLDLSFLATYILLRVVQGFLVSIVNVL